MADFIEGRAYDLNRAHMSGEILVKFHTDADPAEIDAFKSAIGAEVLGRSALQGIERLALPEGTDLAAVLDLAMSHPAVELADPHYLLPRLEEEEESVKPYDPEFPAQWALENLGDIPDIGDQGLENFLDSIAVEDVDIDATRAWAHSTGADVVVAVIDTGIDLDHPELVGNLWVNPGEIAGDGIDNDNNGYIDDIHGFDFGGLELSLTGDEDADPTDSTGHGTHVAGILAADGSNGIGTSGVAPDAQIMVLRVGADDSNLLSGFAILEAIDYAVANGARISNNSYGPIGNFARSTIEAAGAAGHLFVAAAGNDRTDQDEIPAEERIFDLDNVIAVAATSLDDSLVGSSNFGDETIHLAAPGHFILSTDLDGGTRFSSGTSMATPHVSGAAALALQLNPDLSVGELKEAILSTVVEVEALDDLVITGGRLNVGNLVESLLPEPTPVDLYPGAELAQIEGTENADLLRGTGLDERLRGFQGSDKLYGLAGSDVLIGNLGNDRLDGGLGADQMIGGIGSDTYIVDDIGDMVLEEADEGVDLVIARVDHALADNVENLTLSRTATIDGVGNLLNNRIIGSDFANTLEGRRGNDNLVGKDGDDVLIGGSGSDILNGGTGNDRLEGGYGHDRFFVDSEGDEVIELADRGIDKVITLIDLSLMANVENLVLDAADKNLSGTGNLLNNRIDGDAGSNVILGLDGRDHLLGNDGDDTLDGGSGADRLTGGEGEDSFVFAQDEIITRDIITDFTVGSDKVLLDGLAVASIIDVNLGALARLDTGHRILFLDLTSADLDIARDFESVLV